MEMQKCPCTGWCMLANFFMAKPYFNYDGYKQKSLLKYQKDLEGEKS